MSREKDIECRGLVLNETHNAINVCKEHSPAGGPSWWIPRSQIGYLRRSKSSSGGLDHIVFTAPEWLVEKNQFWELVP